MSDNRCVCCGTIVPEGTQVCPACEQKGITVHKETKEERFDRIMNDWVWPVIVILAIVIFGILLFK